MVITAYSSKGGTTKTTTVANLGGLLADKGFKVLCIDGDNTQASLSSYYPLTHQAEYGLVELIKSREISERLISRTSIKGLDVIYSDDNLSELSNFINNSTDGRFRLRRAINDFREKHPDQYDFVFIDTRGAKGHLVDSAIIASDIIITPIKPDSLSAKEFFRGTVGRYLEIKDEVKMLNIEIGNIYAFLSDMQITRDSKLIAESVETIISDTEGVTLLNTIIPHSTAYPSATTAQIPVHLYDDKSYKTIQNASSTMNDLWKELEHHG